MAAATFIVFGTDEMVNLSDIKTIEIVVADDGKVQLRFYSSEKYWLSEPYPHLGAAIQVVKDLDIALHRVPIDSGFSPSGN